MNNIVEIIRRRIDAAKPDEHSIPNCDVRLLLNEIDRLIAEFPEHRPWYLED